MPDITERLAKLEQQVQHLQDLAEIGQIISRYGPLADTADTFQRGQIVGDLWTDDGIYDLGGGWSGQGRDGIAGLLDNDTHRSLVRDGAAHIPSAPHIRIDRDTATAINYSRVYKYVDGTFQVWRVSVNRWEMVRTTEGWKVQTRTNRLLDGSDAAREILRSSADL